MMVLPSTRTARKGGKHWLATLLASAAVLWVGATDLSADIVNSVVAAGTLNGTAVTANTTESVDVVDQIATLAVVKSGVFNDADGDSAADVGETITYSFAVTNSGNVTLNNVVLTDAIVPPGTLTLAGPDDVLPAGDSTDTAAPGWAVLGPQDTLRTTATYVLTQADVDAGFVTNTATATASTVPGLPVSGIGTTTTPLSTLASVAMEKSGTLDLANGVADVGDIISYQFVVTNTGPTTLFNVSVQDPMLQMAALPGADTVQDLIQLAATPTDPITTATITPLEPLGAGPREPQAFVPALPAYATALHATRKLVRLDAGAEPLKAGDRIGVYFTLTNTGDVPLTNIEAVQPGSDAYGGSLDLLPVNTSDSASILFTHTLTQEDIDTGQVDLVSGITARGMGTRVVETLRGSMSLLDVEGQEDIATASISPANITSLAPNASTTFTATYQLTQADIDAGEVLNTATVSANTVLSTVITATDDAAVAVPQAPAIAVEKTASLALGADTKASPGDIITYSFTLMNTGNTTLDDVRLVDPLPGLTLSFTEFDDFAPGDTQNATGTYAITQADIDAGRVENQATASGLPKTQSNRISGTSDDPAQPGSNDKTVMLIPAAPEIALVKEVANVADTNGNSITDVGDTVTYRFKVKNTGNVPLTNVYVQDRDPNVVSNLTPPTGITLAAGVEDTTTFTATYVLRQPDADRGYYDNTADVHGTAPDNSDVTDESDPAVYLEDAPTRVTIAPAPAIAVLKPQPVHADTNTNGMMDAGDVLTYAVQVVNTGNVTLTAVRVTDPAANNFTTTIPTLVPGLANAITVNIPYTITLADMTAGQVENIAFAEATHGGTPVGDQSDTDNLAEDDPTITAIVPRPAIALVKPQPDIIDNGDGVASAGDQLIYTFAVSNTGNVPLNDVTITDPLGTVVSTRTTALQPGDTDDTHFTMTYVLTAGDIATGTVTNQARAAALSPQSQLVTDDSDNDSILQNEATVTVLASLLDPKIALLKQATVTDVNGNNANDLGDIINFAFTVTNTGNVVLSNVTIADARLASESVALVPNNGALASLAVGASAAFTASHTITQADIDTGAYENQATAQAFFGSLAVTDLSDNDSLTENEKTVVALSQTPAIAVIKPQPTNDDANGNGVIDAGDTLTYTFEIHNTGNVTLFNVALVDNNAVVTGGPIASLAPGAVDSTTFTGTRLVTDLDAANGSIVNQATVRAALTNGGVLSISDESDNGSVNGRDPTETPIRIILPGLSKTAARTTVRRGERVEYTIAANSLGLGPYDIADIMPPGFDFVDGSASVNGVAAVPARSGKTLTFAAITPKADHTILVKLSLRAASSTSMATGDFINRARIYRNSTGELLAEATARVTIKEEHVFDCGEIIGRVFDDLNNNGYMDDGEPGLHGVRVVTVKGLLVTTDKHGRFHVTCADVPNAQIGSNFLMKLDPRTLPAGYALTTENPRDVRLTRGKITKLNFGASKRREVALDLTKDAFGAGLDLKPKYVSGVDRLVALLRQSQGMGKGALTITYRCGVYGPIADERLSAVKDLLQAKWKQEGGQKPLKITTRVECGK